ncbi:MAG: hypothetical protein ABW063_08940 [Caulobacter sp.]
MSIIRNGRIIMLQGVCRVEDAEPLAAALQEGGIDRVDLSACEGLHSAVVQALLVFSAPITGEALEPFTRTFVAPALTAQTGQNLNAMDQPNIQLKESN